MTSIFTFLLLPRQEWRESGPLRPLRGHLPLAFARVRVPQMDNETYTLFIKNFHVPFGGGWVGAGFALDSIK